MNSNSRIAASLLVSASLIVQTVPAHANTPGSVRDLVGARAAGGESTIEERGFTLINGSTHNGKKVNYWWNANTKECVRVTTADGRFESIVQTSNSDCNQKGSSGDKTAAIAVGAAALLGIAALASKSHHREGGNYDERGTAEFERGYRDGLYNQSYHNYTRSDPYSRGYEQGVSERGHQTSYRSGNHHGGGYSDYSPVNDLVGQSRDSGIRMLQSRGFAMRDNKQTEDGRYMTFWRANSRQCLVVQSQNKVIISAEDVSESTCSY